MTNCTFALLFLLLSFVLADKIHIHGPPRNGIYYTTDVMDIRYSVRSMGMTKIWSTIATLTHTSTNKTIDTFPLIRWVDGQRDSNNSTPSSIHEAWTIPATIPLGNYSLTISGNTTYVCSKNNDGTAPFDRCHSVLHEKTTFFITNGTETQSIN